MNKSNVFSVLLIMLFMVSCFAFFGVSAEPEDDNDNPTDNVTESTVAHTTTTSTTKSTTSRTTTRSTSKSTKTTTRATASDPHYTTPTAATQAPLTNASSTAAMGAVTSSSIAAQTKETKEIQTTEEITEPTTAAKNIVDYGSKYRPLKWLSLVVMIGCVIALIAVNVRYKKKYGRKGGKPSSTKGSNKNSKPKLDTSARFDEPAKKTFDNAPYRKNGFENNLDKTTVVDISSFSKGQEKLDDFKPKSSNDASDDIFGEKNNDDDLYI